MKRLFYLLVILTITFLTGEINGQFKYGVIGGLNIADLKSDNDIIESRTMAAIGGLIEYNFTENISLVAEPTYLQKGGLQPENTLNPEIRINLEYFEFPLLLKYKFDLTDVVKPYLLAGPTIGYRLSADMEAYINMVTFTGDLKNVSQPFDIGVTMGGGFEIPINDFSFVFEGRYSLGLNDIHKNGTFQASGGGVTVEETFTDDNWFKTKGIQLLFGMKFSFSGSSY